MKSTPQVLSYAWISIVVLSLSGATAFGQGAQAPAQSQPPAAKASPDRATDIGVSVYQAMNSATTANNVTQTPNNSIGGMFELRHIHSPLIGYELSYSYHQTDETVGPSAAGTCGIFCSVPAQKLSSSVSLVGLNWVFSKKYGSLRPFAAGGIGFLITEPSSTTYGVNDVVRPSYLYGGGVDWAFTQHLGVRLQYRGALYKVPNISTLFPAQGVYTTTSMPMGGLFYSF